MFMACEVKIFPRTENPNKKGIFKKNKIIAKTGEKENCVWSFFLKSMKIWNIPSLSIVNHESHLRSFFYSIKLC